jgi:hypothetical protein
MLAIIFGLFLVVVGIMMVLKPSKFVEMLGTPKWSEKVFGYNHGTTAYITIGVIMIFVGMIVATGVESFVRSLF